MSKPVTRIFQIIDVEPYTMLCRFSDKSVRKIDFGAYLAEHRHHRLIKLLLDPNRFMQVSLDELGA